MRQHFRECAIFLTLRNPNLKIASLVPTGSKHGEGGLFSALQSFSVQKYLLEEGILFLPTHKHTELTN